MSKLWYSIDVIIDVIHQTPIYTGVFSTSTGTVLDVYQRVNTNVIFTNVLITPNPNGGGNFFNPLWSQFNVNGIIIKLSEKFDINFNNSFQVEFFSLNPFNSDGITRYYYIDNNGIIKTKDVLNTVIITSIPEPRPSPQTTLLYQFPANFVFRIVNSFFFAFDWGDGTNVESIEPGSLYSYHKYKLNKIYKVTFFSTTPIPYTLFTYPDGNNGFGYIINCPNATIPNDTIKLNHTFNEQGYASDIIKKRKDQTIYANLKSRNPLMKELPKTYRSYESLKNINNGYLYCKFNSIYAFQ